MRNNSNTPHMGNPIAAEAANTYTNLDGNVIEPDYDDTEDGEGVEA